MTVNIRDYDYNDTAPVEACGAAWFDGDILDYVRGGSLCGSATLVYLDGGLADALCICSAPTSAWRVGKTDPWETLIVFSDRAGAKAALRVARWLLRGDPSARLVINGDISLHVGAKHAKRPCWRRLAEAAPGLFPWREEQFSLIGEEVLPPHPNTAAERRHNRVLATSEDPQ